MNLFEDDNKNEAAPAQEPVSAKPAEKPKPTVTPAAKANKKPLKISDYAWIGGIAVIAILLLVWLFGAPIVTLRLRPEWHDPVFRATSERTGCPCRAGFW